MIQFWCAIPSNAEFEKESLSLLDDGIMVAIVDGDIINVEIDGHVKEVAVHGSDVEVFDNAENVGVSILPVCKDITLIICIQ